MDGRYSITFPKLKWNEMEAINISKSKSLKMNLAEKGTQLCIFLNQTATLIYLREFLEESDK